MADLLDDDVVPEWLDAELWQDFISNRKEAKKAMTPTAVRRMLRKLERWHARGINVNECLERSIISNWKDIYEPEERPAASAADHVNKLFARGYRLDVSEDSPAARNGSEQKH